MSRKKPFFQYLKSIETGMDEKELYSAILCGELRYGGEVIKDPKQVIVIGNEWEHLSRKYVSRGGDKLEGIMSSWAIDARGAVILDAGCSTGGFVDCLLQAGAARVYAVDVGYNQLDFKLRNNSRVIVMEKTNIMSLDTLEPVPDFAVADLSFRSITGAADKILSLCSRKEAYVLVKPQFEDVSDIDDFDGIVRDEAQQLAILDKVVEELNAANIDVLQRMPSLVKGRKGNQEYFFHIKKRRELHIQIRHDANSHKQ